MITDTYAIAASADDGLVRSDGLINPAIAVTYVGIDNVGLVWHSWNRWFVTIPENVYITSAIFQWYNYYNYIMPVQTRMYGELGASPTVPISYADYVGRARTTAYKNIGIPVAPVSFTVNQTDILAIVQELYATYDYTSGNWIQLLWDNNGPAGIEQHVGAFTYDWNIGVPLGTYGARLVLNYIGMRGSLHAHGNYNAGITGSDDKDWRPMQCDSNGILKIGQVL